MKSRILALLVFLASFGMQAQELVSGKATLTKLNDGVYEIKKEDGTFKKIDIRPNVEEHLQGTLSVLFKDCEKIRQEVFNLTNVSETNLIQTVENYNNCDYTPFEPTQKEAKHAANFQGDKYRLFANIGVVVNRIGYFNSGENESLTQGQLGFGLAATPGFTGTLQGNLYFTLELNAAFSGDKDFSNAPFATNLKRNSYRASLGTEFHFNKNGSFQPLIGVGVGLVQDHYNGNYNNYRIKQTQGSAFWIPKAGILFSLEDKKSLGIIVSYIPEYENDLSFINEEEVIPLIINTHSINAGLYFYF